MDLFKIFGTVVVETKEAVEKLGKVSEEAKNTSEEAEKSGKKTSNAFKSVAKAAAVVGTAIVAVGAAMVEIAESTREYRVEMGKLETAFTMAGHSSENAQETYRALQSVLGETDTAVEAANHLAKLVSNEQDLQVWTDICTGVFATFGDSLPIEGLTEAANETAKVGTVTGVLADALNWAGVSEDEFNAKLATCNSEQERTVLITETLNRLYNDTAQNYKKNNKAILDANAAQEKWNSAMGKVGSIVEPVVSILKSGLASAISFVADRFLELRDNITETVATLAGTSETSEEAAKKIEELQEKIEALEATDPAFWNEMMQQEYDMLRLALGEAQTQYAELEEAEKSAATTGSETAAQMQIEAEEYAASAQELIDKFTEVYNGYAEKVGNWFAPYEQAKTTTVTSIQEMMAAMQSQIEFNETYNANLQTLKEYGLADLAAAFESYGAEGAVYAQTIVESIEEAGGASSEGGQKIIDDFRTLDSEVANSQSDLAETMTTLSGEFDESIGNIVTTVTQGVADIDKGVEAYDAAAKTLSEYIRGVDEKIPDVLQKFSSLGRQITDSLQASIGTITIKFKGSSGDGVINPSANGLERVPYDGYPATLHRNEMVLPASQADFIRSGGFAEMASQSNAAVIGVLGQILEAVQNGGTQETVLKLNDRELGRAVRGYVYA